MTTTARTTVAQTAGLPYRRLPACEACIFHTQQKFNLLADRRSATQQTSGLRYD